MYSTKTRPPIDFGNKMAVKYIKEISKTSELIKQAEPKKEPVQIIIPPTKIEPSEDEFSKLLEEKLEKMDTVLLALKDQQMTLNKNYMESTNKINELTSKLVTQDSFNELKNVLNNYKPDTSHKETNGFITHNNVVPVVKEVVKEKKAKKSYYPITDKMWEESVLKKFPELPVDCRPNIFGDGTDFYIGNNKKKNKLNEKEVLKLLNKKRNPPKEAA